MNLFRKIVRFYVEGFRNMTVGRNLWIIILIKLFIIFAVFRLLFFPDFLEAKFTSDQEKSDYIIDELINKLP